MGGYTKMLHGRIYCGILLIYNTCANYKGNGFFPMYKSYGLRLKYTLTCCSRPEVDEMCYIKNVKGVDIHY